MTLDSFKRVGILYPEISYVTSAAVGFPVAVYWVGLNGPGGEGSEYQVMRWDESPGPGLDFWRWHLGAMPQFFPTPEAAAAAFVASYAAWRGTRNALQLAILDGPAPEPSPALLRAAARHDKMVGGPAE